MTDWLTAIGTVGAVIVALFGQHFRAKFFPPKLRLQLDDVHGVFTPAQLSSEESKPRMEGSRYYHVKVTNRRRWSPAHNLQIWLLRLDQLAANGQPGQLWVGQGIPLRWQHQELYPPARVIGADANIDLCSVVRGKWLEIHPLLKPFSLTTRYESACTLLLTIQARSDEVDSVPMQVRIRWDGGWHDGAAEMARHMLVEVMPM